MPAETENEFVMKMIEPITVTAIRFSHSTPLKRYCLHHEWKAQRFKYRDNVEDVSETVECWCSKIFDWWSKILKVLDWKFMKNFTEKYCPILNLEEAVVDGKRDYLGGLTLGICKFLIYMTKR